MHVKYQTPNEEMRIKMKATRRTVIEVCYLLPYACAYWIDEG